MILEFSESEEGNVLHIFAPVLFNTRGYFLATKNRPETYREIVVISLSTRH